jgi:hypothetical protein
MRGVNLVHMRSAHCHANNGQIIKKSFDYQEKNYYPAPFNHINIL